MLTIKFIILLIMLFISTGVFAEGGNKKAWIPLSQHTYRVWIPPELKAVWVPAKERPLKDGGFMPGYYKAVVVRPGYYTSRRYSN